MYYDKEYFFFFLSANFRQILYGQEVLSHITGKWNSDHNMVIVHLYNVELISIQFLPFIFGNFDGDIGSQTVLDQEAYTF